jgi:branched-chain amino acid transport system permease protein
MLLNYAGIGYWPALVIAPIVVGLSGIVIERAFLKRIYKLDHIYGFLLTFGLSLVIEGIFRVFYGTSGQPYFIPTELQGGFDFGFIFLPYYRVWVICFSVVVCLGTWYLIERTRLGAYLRAATENATLVEAFGINVPRMITLTYGFGVALAALAGVMVAPIYQVGSLMGSNIIGIVFAVVAIGGLTSIRGSIIGGFVLGVVEGLTKVFYPAASSTVIFVTMAIILLVKPAGLFGTVVLSTTEHVVNAAKATRPMAITTVSALLGLALIAPFFLYPTFLMIALCYALFACSFNLLLGYAGLMSFGHAAFFGAAAYVTAHTIKVWGLPPELGIVAGTAAAALLGLVFGWIAIRRQGIYFAMITFSLASIVFFYAVQAPWTYAEDGIQAVPRGSLLGLIDLNQEFNLYYVVLGIFLFGFAVCHRTIHSPFGEVLSGIRGNQLRAMSLGYRVDQYKLVAFILSAAIAGLAGATKCLVFQMASLSDVNWTMSGHVVLMTLVGGLGTELGPVVGAFIVVAMENYLAELGSWVTIIQGVIFVLCVLVFRRGIIGELLHLVGRLRSRSEGVREAALSPEPVVAYTDKARAPAVSRWISRVAP